MSTRYVRGPSAAAVKGRDCGPILFLSQALDAILFLVLLPFMRSLGRDRELMGAHALGPAGRLTTGLALATIAVSVLALAVLSLP